ncbi:MAG TPA: hypothetical protein VGZ25_03105 [Gemmataceae bacterium]|jgi:hypothetical protein|nr:hypothetical protein [Gemmataceae bacterium]
MRNLLAFVAAAAITLAAIGWYRDWFQIQSQSKAPGSRSVEININTLKIDEDLKKGEQKIIEKTEQKLHEQKDTTQDSSKASGEQGARGNSPPTKRSGL